jgi:hypothetical protein
MDLDGWARPSLSMIIHGPLASQTKKIIRTCNGLMMGHAH